MAEIKNHFEEIGRQSALCECGCGNYALVIHTDLLQNCRYKLCKNCEMAFVNLALSPEQFFSLIEKGHTTREHMLHEDFYDEKTGEALQPQ